MQDKGYKVGTTTSTWKNGDAQTITFIVTYDCNLRCKYCYITHKSSSKRMNFSVAKNFIDYILASDTIKFSEAVILEFIGGEPLIEVELVDKICDYFKLKSYELDHKWSWNYRISICTNGVNYSNDQVQNFIKKNYHKLSLGITVDGTKEKHDLQRVFIDGTGSFDTINKNIDLWISQFPGSTKVTFASDDLCYLKDSIIYLWNRGIKTVNSNVVFENVWKDGDDKIFENQLFELADYILDNKLYNSEYICSFFDDTIGYPYEDIDMDKTHCGAGKMMAISPDGKIFPCIRYCDYSLNKHDEWSVGDIENGIDMEKVRPFMLASNRIQSDPECLNCPIASGCAFCQGFNYDDADTPTNFHRAKYICKMHKARVKANNYYFAKLYNMYGVEKQEYGTKLRNLYILLSNDYVSYCDYNNSNLSICEEIDADGILRSLKYCRDNFFEPIIVHNKSNFNFKNDDKYIGYNITHIVHAKYINEAKKIVLKNIVPVYEKESLEYDNQGLSNVIFNIESKDIANLSKYIIELFKKVQRIDLNIHDIDKNFNESLYKNQLEEISNYIKHFYKENETIKELSVLTDVLFINKHDNCMAGENTFIISPEEKIYQCCAIYSNEKDNNIGDIKKGITVKYDKRLYEIENSNLCRICDCYQCKNCIYSNKKFTKEVNVAPSFICRKSHIERLVSKKLYDEIYQSNINIMVKNFDIYDELDPIQKFLSTDNDNIGYYLYKKSI